MPLKQGQILQGRYYIESEMKKGGGGTIYCASYYLNRSYYYAIKENSHSDNESRKQFITEAGLLMELNNSNLLLPKAIEYFEENGRQYLVMEFIPGTNLDGLLTSKDKLTELETLRYIDQICDTLECLHSRDQPIIHRDIKPQNIIITLDGNAYLVDFGLSKIHSSQQTNIGGRGVTPGFSPPEQYSNKGTDHRSDIYALGATLYNLLTNQILPEPYQVKKQVSPRKFNSQISPHVEQAILKAIALKPEQRFQRVSDMKNALHTPLPFWQQPSLIRSFGITVTVLTLMSIIGVLIFSPDYPPASAPTVTSIMVSVTSITSRPTSNPTVALPSPTSSVNQTIPSPTVEPMTTKITTSTPLPQLTRSQDTATPEPIPIDILPTLISTLLPTNTPERTVENVEIPVDKSAMVFENLSGTDLVIDIIGPTSIDALAVPPNNKKVVTIEPGTYTFNAHAPNGTVSLSSDNFNTNANQWIEVIIFTTDYQQSIKDW